MEITRPRLPLQKKNQSEKKSIFSKKLDFLAFKSPFELTTIGVKDTDMIKIYFYGA